MQGPQANGLGSQRVLAFDTGSIGIEGRGLRALSGTIEEILICDDALLRDLEQTLVAGSESEQSYSQKSTEYDDLFHIESVLRLEGDVDTNE